MRKRALAALLAAPLLAQPPSEEWRSERSEWKEAVPAGLPLAIENPHGEVRVEVAERDDVAVAAVSRQRAGDARPIDVAPRREADRWLLAVNPEARAGDGPRVDLEVAVPAASPLAVRTTSGALVVSLAAGRPRGLDLETVTGDIELELAPEADLAVEIDTQGEIRTDFSLAVERAGLLRKRARARLGSGAAAARLASHQGNVSLRERRTAAPRPAPSPPDERSSVPAGAPPAMEEWSIERRERVVPFPPGTALAVENLHGDLRVRVNDRPEVLVLTWSQRHRDDPRAMELLLDSRDGRTVLRVAEPPLDPAAPAAWARRRVDLSLLVPPAAVLEVATDAGLIEVKGHAGAIRARSRAGELRLWVSGPLEGRSERGSIVVFFRSETWSHPARLETALGSIEASFPARSDADVTLDAPGAVTTDFSIEIERLPAGRRRGTVRLGRGGPAVRMASQQGELEILQLPELPGRDGAAPAD